jgi:signal transduction histidine kinase
MHELSGHESPGPDGVDVDHAQLLRTTLERAAAEAEARRVSLDLSRLPAGPVAAQSDPQALEHLLDAAIGAALKMSGNRTLGLELVSEGTEVLYRIRNTGLDPATLNVERIDSGAALRMRIARGLAGRLGGRVRLVEAEDGTTLEIAVPAGPN